jgi:Mn2+/Fe2+ NRAMP family transporter
MSAVRTAIKKNDPRDLRLVTVGQGVSLVGDAITALALPIVAVDLLKADSLGTGLLGAASTVAYLLIGLQAGVWVDRASRRKVLIVADVARVLLLLAVPVLAGSAAYAVSETFGWVEGLDRKPREAKAFYGVIAVATLAGFALNFIGIDPMKALYWAAVVNGMLAPPLMIITMLIARNPKVMGGLVISKRLAFGGWLSTVVMVVIAGLFLWV